MSLVINHTIVGIRTINGLLNLTKLSLRSFGSVSPPYRSLSSTPKFQSQSQTLPNDDHTSSSDHQDTSEEPKKVKEDILEASLNHVNSCGWNLDAISLGAVDLGLSPSVSNLFKDSDLVHYFIMKSNDELEVHLAETQPKVELQDALKHRLEMVSPFAKGYSEALALIAQPQNFYKSSTLLLELADSIAHYSLKDSSTNTSWYTKRLGIAGIYASCEMCLIQDSSPHFSETWAFLARRVKDFNQLNAGQLSLPSPDLIRVGLTSLSNILGRNARR